MRRQPKGSRSGGQFAPDRSGKAGPRRVLSRPDSHLDSRGEGPNSNLISSLVARFKNGGESKEEESSKPLLHGTIHSFTVGDVITPQSGEKAFATTDERLAARYAARGNARALSDEDEIATDEEPALFGAVYTVEPVADDIEHEEVSQAHLGKFPITSSTTGFRVTGIHSLVREEDAGERKKRPAWLSLFSRRGRFS